MAIKWTPSRFVICYSFAESLLKQTSSLHLKRASRLESNQPTTAIAFNFIGNVSTPKSEQTDAVWPIPREITLIKSEKNTKRPVLGMTANKTSNPFVSAPTQSFERLRKNGEKNFEFRTPARLCFCYFFRKREWTESSFVIARTKHTHEPEKCKEKVADAVVSCLRRLLRRRWSPSPFESAKD